MKTILCATPLMGLILLAGCGLDGPVPGARKPDVAPANNTPAPSSAPAQAASDKKSPENAASQTSSVADSPSEKKPGRTREKAAVGAGEKGRGYGGDMISVSVKTYWLGREKITYDQVRHALDLYKATEGHTPKNHEEFMKVIVEANHLHLPALPEGQRYVYDPGTDELMVERPGLD